MATDISTLQVQVRTNLDRLNKELKEATRNSANYSDEYKKLKRETDATYRSQLKFEQGLKAIGNQFQLDEANAEEYLQELHRLEQAHKTGGLASQGMGVDMRNLSYQVQDVAVQASMGTDALRIFSMQGPQIASAFGAGGAAIGAVLAIAGAIGGALFGAAMSGKSALEQLEEALDDLSDMLDMTKYSVSGLSEEMLELAKSNRTMFELELARGFYELNKALASASGEIEGVGRRIIIAARDFSASQQTMHVNSLQMQEENERTEQTFYELANSLGLNEEELLSLSNALGNFAQNQDVASAEALLNIFGELNDITGLNTEAFNELTFSTVPLLQRILLTADGLDVLAESAENVEEIIANLDDGLREITDVNALVTSIREARGQISDAQTEALAMFEADSQWLETYSNNVQKELVKTQQMKAEQIRLGQEEVAQRKQQTTQLLAFSDMLLQGEGKNAQASARLGLNLLNAEKRANAGKILSDSYAAAMSAYKALAGIPLIGPALGAAASATILAAGVSYSAKSLSGRALGGQVRGGESYIVGERGPEVLTMGSSRGFITPNDQLRNQTINNNQGNTANVTFNIVANDTAGFDELLNKRRGQIIGIVNQALNNSGRRALV
jgi:hypothetical protein